MQPDRKPGLVLRGSLNAVLRVLLAGLLAAGPAGAAPVSGSGTANADVFDAPATAKSSSALRGGDPAGMALKVDSVLQTVPLRAWRQKRPVIVPSASTTAPSYPESAAPPPQATVPGQSETAPAASEVAGASIERETRLDDQTLRQTLQRWCKQEGWQLVWEADRDFPIEARVAYLGTFRESLELLMESLAETDYPLQARLNSPARIVRIVRYASSTER